ncbi:SubName: Full=Related to prenylcysteine oxidase {ECO:0000313/EMBL:CCA66843.1} [Serendipita indica DSM 11827]|nr:SubName: Full=Related to prenylcysteine oxidase {ECO:0000313/EMBL:CCA66843.1} [Serendipita indica DSM 11827]
MILRLLPYPTLALALSWSSLFGSKGVAADQYVMQPEGPGVLVPSNPRIAIIGAGAAGSSAANWIGFATGRSQKVVGVDVFERADYVGGRSTVVYPYNDTALAPVELGASIFVDANKNMVRAALQYDLETIEFGEDNELVGIWDGSQFLVTTGNKGFFGKIWENIRLLWRYGYRSPMTVNALVKQMVNTYLSLYTTITSWNSVEAVSSALNFTSLTEVDTATYLANQGIGEAFAFEVVESATRVNYASNLDDIHALEGLVSMAPNGAKSIKGGNYQVFANMLKFSEANVHLKTKVKSLQRGDDDKWTLIAIKDTPSGPTTMIEKYDAVIIAAPYDTLEIDLPSSVAPVAPTAYTHLHVTLLTTKSPQPKGKYFHLKDEAVPTMVLTTAQGIRAGRTPPEFNSLSYHGKVAEDRDEWNVKIFSMQPLSDEWLHDVFGHVGWVHRKEWDAYPRLPPTTRYNPMKLDKNLYYVNGFESFISTMETQTLASRGVVELAMHELFGFGLCPPDYQSSPPEDGEFIWGWDYSCKPRVGRPIAMPATWTSAISTCEMRMKDVPGPATNEELRTLYPPLYTFPQLKGFIESGDLGLLKRHPDLQTRYNTWCAAVKEEYGTLGMDYLVRVRLGWAEDVKPKPTFASATNSASATPNPLVFRADLPEGYIKVIPNDWPYSVPLDVSHFVIWSRVPAISPANIPISIQDIVKHEGLWGFTGNSNQEAPIPPEGVEPRQPLSEMQATHLLEACSEFDKYVKINWPEDNWECAWFVNPPRLQSVPGLAHIHVFARRK